MSFSTWPENITELYYGDINYYRSLNKYQREHVLMCRCGKMPHALGSLMAKKRLNIYGIHIVYFVWKGKTNTKN